ncbi:hypothetical protein G5B38_13810 [Pseudohalocynthiibacter aestuariivivens]|nr:hypothetical protein [Pseudohalocynthiibacter aestuariivivens]QIE46511.1 hypothetical protein G5B38_13810 [Pseudohalocynthiibacter aestuariivivens]
MRAKGPSLDQGTLCKFGHLEEGNLDELAEQCRELKDTLPQMNVFGGACGTDYAHVCKIAQAVLTVRQAGEYRSCQQHYPGAKVAFLAHLP